MVEFRFFVEGDPKGQPRPRRSLLGGVYNPGVADGWKQAVFYEARRHAPREPLEGPLDVSIDFIFRRPKRGKKTAVFAAVRPDRDNLDKAVLDALQAAGFFRDDAQVCTGVIRKLYTTPAAPAPGAFITIVRLT